MKRIDELTDPTSCINKAGDDEPVFVLRANDPLAPAAVDYWANMAVGGDHDQRKIEGAREIAREMRRWRTEKKRE